MSCCSTTSLLVVVLLLPAGAAWLAVLSSLGAATQVFLPGWVRARGLSVQQIVFMGGQAVGAVIWGLVAQYTGLVIAFVVASTLMVLGAATIAVLPLHDTEGLDRTSTVYWPEPQLFTEPDPDEGPVLITLTFTVPPDNVARFLEAMQRVRCLAAPNRRHALEPLPRRRRSLSVHRDLFRPVLGGTSAPTPRTPHRCRPRYRARRPRTRHRSAPGRPPLPRPGIAGSCAGGDLGLDERRVPHTR